jgi:hypothetical protein
MGVAVDLLDGVVAKLNETTFGSATVSRGFIIEVARKGLSTPEISVCLDSKESFEIDRGNECLKYTVAVGLHYPTTSDADLDLGMDMLEDIQDWLSDRSNRAIVTSSGTFKLHHPVALEAPLDATMAREMNCYYSVITLPYLFYKVRN